MLDYIISCLWGFAEATFFFFIPDIYLTRIAIYNLRRALLACFFTAISACLGGSIMYFWAQHLPQQAIHSLLYVPAIFPSLIKEVFVSLNNKPYCALILAPLKGIPYKIYAVAFGANKMDFGLFILASFFARLIRFILITLIGGLLTKLISRYCQRKTLFYLHTYSWGIIYVVYFCLEVLHS